MPQTIIQLFAKAPVKGRVKTRMQPFLTEDESLTLYRYLLRTMVGVVASVPSPVELWAALDAQHPFLAALAKQHGVLLKEQVGVGLGEKLDYAIADGLDRAHAVIVVGGDCVSIDASYIRDAQRLLDQGVDVVIGPAQDGGFVLIGLRTYDRALFEGVAWGSAAVLNQVRDNIKALGWQSVELDARWDVDEPADLEHLSADWRSSVGC